MPANLLALFGGHSDIVPLLDGAAHAQRKRGLLAAFSPEAIAAYLYDREREIMCFPGLGKQRLRRVAQKLMERAEAAAAASNDVIEIS